MCEFIHNKTQMSVFVVTPPATMLENAFGINFYTPQDHSKGVQHICEHSVLCGSKKFQVKEPFSNLLQSSLQTFLNAMTYSQHTCYPVMTRCYQDFLNLMQVYLDAVFNPMMLSDERIFKQEGHHLHLESIDDELRYSGVVLNEMRGDKSDVESASQMQLQKNLMHGTCMGAESGGDPSEILKLSYQEFCEFHENHYKPSNACVFLMTRFPLDEILALIDSFLQPFQFEPLTEIKIESPKPIKFDTFQVDAENSYLYRGIYVKHLQQTSPLEFYAVRLLDYLLHDCNGAALRVAIEDCDFCEACESVLDDSDGYTIVSQKFTNVTDNEKLLNLIRSVYNQVTNQETGELNGYLTEKRVKGVVNHMMIEHSQVDSEYGIMLMQSVFRLQLAGMGDQIESFMDFKKVLNEIENMEWEQLKQLLYQLTKEYFLNEQSVLAVEPCEGLQKRQQEAELLKMKQLKESMTEQQLKEIIEDTLNTIKRQQDKDKLEDVAQLPKLNSSHLDGLLNELKTLKFQKINGINFLKSDSDIIYTQLRFFPPVKSVEDMQWMSLLSSMLSNVDLTNMTLQQLSQEITSLTGGINFSTDSFAGEFQFVVNFLALQQKFTSASEIVQLILQKSDLQNQKRLKDLYKKELSELQAELEGDEISELLTCNNAASILKSSVIEDATLGFSYLQFLQNKKQFLKDLQRVLKMINESHCEVFISCKQEIFDQLDLKYIKQYNFNPIEQNCDFIQLIEPQTIPIQSDVNFVYKTIKIEQITPQLLLANQLVSKKFLWDVIRVKNGAYGAGVYITQQNSMQLFSYRDPNSEKTVEVFNSIWQYLENVQVSDEELDQLKIGTIGERQPPSSPEERLEKAITYYYQKVNPELYADLIDNVRFVTVQGVKKQAEIFKQFIQTKPTIGLGK